MRSIRKQLLQYEEITRKEGLTQIEVTRGLGIPVWTWCRWKRKDVISPFYRKYLVDKGVIKE